MVTQADPSPRRPVEGSERQADSQFSVFMRDIVACFDSNLRHTYVNAAVEDFTGRPASDFLGKTNREMGMPDALVEQWDHELRTAFDTGLPSEIQFSFESPSGTRLIRSRLAPQANAKGVVTSVISSARVINSEHIDALTSEHFRAIIESSDDAIISKTLDGIVTSWNRGAERIFGYTSEEMTGKPLLALFPPDRKNEEGFILERILLGEKVDHFETVRARKDGSLVPISVSISPIYDRQGNVIGASKVARDITDRVAAEMTLQATLKEKEALLNEVHHRVRNNLQVITSLLRLTVGHSAEPSFRDLLDDTRGRIRAMALVDESIERKGGHTLVRLDHYIQNLATQTFKNVRPEHPSSKLRLHVSPAMLPLDRASPFGLLVNEIMSLRIKTGFLHDYPGEMTISLELAPADGVCTLRISDNGMGFSSVFEAGRHGAIGLRLIRDLTRQVDGALSVHQREPGGAVFEVKLKALTPH